MGELDCTKGITLNSQLTDLLSIIDMDIPQESQDRMIETYISDLESRQNGYLEASSRGSAARYEYIISTILEKNPALSVEDKEKIKGIYLDNLSQICSPDVLQNALTTAGISSDVHTQVLKDLRNIDMTAKEGVLDLTPEKVRALHGHMFRDGGNTYDRITFDNAGKYSSYVSIDGRTYADERLKGMLEFAERHGMKSKVNTLMMYCDFPKQLETYLQGRVDSGEITEDEMKQTLKSSLMDYVTHIGETYGDRLDTVDIFNELIYDPAMSEQGFGEQDGYHVRREGWQKYLTTRDLCEVALEARRVMPNVTFTYNDMNWVNPEKRDEILQVVSEIQDIESEYVAEGRLAEGQRLIDTIGLEAHLTTGMEPEDFEQVFIDVQEKTRLPIEITELDCARTGKNPESRKEIKKQKKIFSTVMALANKYDAKAVTIWSQTDELSFMNEKCGRNVHASLLDENFDERTGALIDRSSLWEKIKNVFSRKEAEIVMLPEAKENVFFENLHGAVMPPNEVNEIPEKREEVQTRENQIV